MSKKNSYPGSIDRRAGSYRVRLCVGGVYHGFTLRTGSRKDAERFAREKHRELERLLERRVHGLPEVIHISELLRQFEQDELPTLAPGTRRSYRDSLTPIREYFVEKGGNPRLDQIHAKHIKSYLAWRRVHRLNGKKPLSGRTLAKDRAVLHRIFEIAERLEYREGNPVGKVEIPRYDQRDPVLLTDDEYERLLKECESSRNPMLSLYTLFLGETGVRCRSEALWLRWEDLDLPAKFVWISSGRDGHRTKSGKGRWVPITSRLRAAFEKHVNDYSQGGSPWVFHHQGGSRNAEPGDRIASFRNAFDAAAKRAGLPSGFHRHDLRHRRVTSWLAKGGNPVHVKEAVGHADLRTTMGYTHLSREHLRSLLGEEDQEDSKG